MAPEAIARWEVAGVGKRGGQLQYSDVAIETALTLRLLFHLPLRQTEGFLRSIFGMLGLDLSAPRAGSLEKTAAMLTVSASGSQLGRPAQLDVSSPPLGSMPEDSRGLERTEHSAVSDGESTL